MSNKPNKEHKLVLDKTQAIMKSPMSWMMKVLLTLVVETYGQHLASLQNKTYLVFRKRTGKHE